VSVHSDQLQLDLDSLIDLIEQLDDHRRIEAAASRLLETLVRRGLDDRALLSAAALVLELDRPPEDVSAT
jgi:hypothetical protein